MYEGAAWAEPDDDRAGDGELDYPNEDDYKVLYGTCGGIRPAVIVLGLLEEHPAFVAVELRTIIDEQLIEEMNTLIALETAVPFRLVSSPRSRPFYEREITWERLE